MDFLAKIDRLQNGVRVLTVPMPGVESIAAMVLIKTGSRNESDEQSGISHVLEHMLFKGTELYPTAFDLASAVDALGAEYNAYTGKEYTGYYIHADARHIETSLKILSQMITAPTIGEEELKREQGVIIEEINMYEDQPAERAEEEIENLLYSGELGRLIIGSKQTVAATTPESIRLYKDRWYKGANVLIVLVGKVKEIRRQLLTQVEERFGMLAAGGLEPFVSQGGYGNERANHLKKKTEQAHFAMAWPGYSLSDPKRYSAKVLSNILGGTMSSRLFTEVREKRGLAYYVRASHDTMADVGQFVVRAGVKLDKLKEAVEVVREQTLNIAKTVSQAELTLAKENIRGRIVLSLTSPMSVAQFYGHRTLITDELMPASEVLAGLDRVELTDIVAVAKELLTAPEERLVVVGPDKG